MGEYTSVAEFVKRIDEMGAIIARPTERAMIDAGVVFGEIVDKAADQAGATSYAGQKRPRYRVHKRGHDVYIRPGNVGANVVLNSGARPHIIGASGRGTRAAFRKFGAVDAALWSYGFTGAGQFSRKVRTRRDGSQRAKALKFGDEFATIVRHPGMDGFGFLAKSRDKATERGAEVYLRAKRRELGGAATR